MIPKSTPSDENAERLCWIGIYLSMPYIHIRKKLGLDFGYGYEMSGFHGYRSGYETHQIRVLGMSFVELTKLGGQNFKLGLYRK